MLVSQQKFCYERDDSMHAKQKRMAAEILGCGVSRVRVKQTKELEEALTRDDIRNLISSGAIYTLQKKGTSRWHARIILRQKKKKRRRGMGTKKGRLGTRFPKKGEWMKTVRALRRLLKELRDNKQIEKKVYKQLYYQVKGGMFRNKSHLLYYIKEHRLLLGKKPIVKKETKQEKTEKQKAETAGAAAESEKPSSASENKKQQPLS